MLLTERDFGRSAAMLVEFVPVARDPTRLAESRRG